MLERKIRVGSNNPEHSAPVPAERKARIEREGSVDHRDRHVKVLTADPEHEGSEREHLRVFGCRLERAARETDRQTTVHFAIARVLQFMMAKGAQRESRAVPGVTLDRLPKEIERPVEAVSLIGA